MSVLTANTLFHFTPSIEFLFSIIENGFRPTYCPELGDAINNRFTEIYIPMVCFCDLPMSKLQNHMDGSGGSKKYGHYGLGMSKEWGMKMNINPVTYIHPNSQLFHSLGLMHNQLVKMYSEVKSIVNELISQGGSIKGSYRIDASQVSSPQIFPISDPFQKLRDLEEALSNAYVSFAFLKPYKDNKYNRLFYDEREWRYIIPYTTETQSEVPYLVRKSEEDYIKIFPDSSVYKKENFQEIINLHYMLKFHYSDIKYIILQDETEIHGLIEKLRTIYPPEEVEILTTKIITCEGIFADF